MVTKIVIFLLGILLGVYFMWGFAHHYRTIIVSHHYKDAFGAEWEIEEPPIEVK